MLPRRLLARASPLATCPCRCHVASASLQARTSAIRTLSSTSSRWKPAAQLAEPEPDFEPSYYHTPPTAWSPLSLLSTPSLSGLHVDRPMIQLPDPLPSDVSAPPTDPRSALYPTTGILDAHSMISVCLRTPEHIPRAYQIFRQLLEENRKGLTRMPDASVWGKVIEGAAKLGREVNPNDTIKSAMWRRRARDLVDRWETHHRTSGLPVLAGGNEDGIKVYQGWFAGTVR